MAASSNVEGALTAYSHTDYSSIAALHTSAVEVISSVTKDAIIAVEDFALFPELEMRFV